jgi:hypothetical protein
MAKVARGSGDSWSMSAKSFDMERNEFDDERDTARALFYIVEEIQDVPVRDAEGKVLLDFTKPRTSKKGETVYNILTEEKLIPVEYVRIQGPGEHLNVFAGRVTDEHRRRFSRAYEAFKKGEEGSGGTALSKWPRLANNIEMQAQLRALGYICVEDIANMPDGAIHEFHGASEWRKYARVYVAEHKKTTQIEKDAAEKQATDAKFQALQAQIEALTAALAEKGNAAPVSDVKQRGKPGPKPKPQAQAAPAAA